MTTYTKSTTEAIRSDSGEVKVRLTSHSRNLAIGWTNVGQGLELNDPKYERPDGGIERCEAELARAVRLNRGNCFTASLFVAGRRVEEYRDTGWDEWTACRFLPSSVLAEIRINGYVDVRLAATQS